jgi:DNA-binding transcriptional MerR regulator
LDRQVTQASSTRRPLLKAVEVCDIAKVQPYVLRSWEKEFPSLGVSKDPDGPRFYRKADLDEVLRIRQLVYGEGLTIAGARRKLEEERAQPPDGLPFDDVDEEPAGKSAAKLSAKARTRIDGIRKGLRAILELLDQPAARTRGSNGDAQRNAPKSPPPGAGGRSGQPTPVAHSKSRRSTGARRRAS